MDELTYVPVGTDRFRAQLITEACRAAGLEVELLTADDSGTYVSYGEVQPHRLLVESRELEQVRAVVEKAASANRSNYPVPER